MRAEDNLLECRSLIPALEVSFLVLPTNVTWLSEPHWHWASRQRRALPKGLRSWLLDQSSLTAKLIELSGGDFEVQVLCQHTGRPSLSERRRLGLGLGDWVLMREVVLWGRGEPWVFARSLVPMTSLVGPLRQLRHLSARPLGAFLFAQPRLAREPIEVSRIRPADTYVPVSLQGDARLWGRRSVFRLAGKPLLVSEVFLQPFSRMFES